jgi:hypothetical protein
MVNREVATYCLVSVEMIEHELCEVRVKGGQREVEVVRHGARSSRLSVGSVRSRKNGLVMSMA